MVFIHSEQQTPSSKIICVLRLNANRLMTLEDQQRLIPSRYSRPFAAHLRAACAWLLGR